MGLMTRIFGGNSTPVTQTANDGTAHRIDTNQALANTNLAVPSPTNANFSSIRSVPVLTAPRYFTKRERLALAALKNQKVAMAEETRKAYKDLKTIDTADTEVHTVHRQYQSKLAKNEVRKLEANAQLAQDLHKLRPAYAELHQQVETAKHAAAEAINAIRATYGS